MKLHYTKKKFQKVLTKKSETLLKKWMHTFNGTIALHTKVLLQVGLDIGAIVSKSLFSFSCQRDGILIKQQMLSSTIKQKSTSVQA
jgi:hypothetical protein